MFDDLAHMRLADFPGGPGVVVLCPTARLAADLRRAHGEAQAHAGATVWRALQSATPAQWLDHLTSAALLRGEIPPAYLPGRFLTRPQERSLWEQAVARDTGSAAADLFDRDGMALAAAEAESLRQMWRIEVPEALHTEEYRAFLRWREAMAKVRQSGDWRTADEAAMWRIECIARGLDGLPERVGIAGFTAPDPLLSRLLAVLAERGVAVCRVDFSREGAAQVSGGECVDAEAECLAAAAWARAFLARNEHARVRIAVADLPARRLLLERALEDALHPHAVGAGWAALERDYVFTAGAPLAAEALVDVGLRLLQLPVHPQRVALAGFGALLCGAGWSADVAEGDARARLEAGLRTWLPPEVALERLQRAVARHAADFPDTDSNSAPSLVTHLTTLLDASREFAQENSRRQLPGVWGMRFDALLAAVGWPGQRDVLPAERAACEAFREVLAGLAQLDAILGPVDAGEALRQVQRECREQTFSALRRRPARVEVCSLADAVAGPVDGLWLMGMNEGLWPPAPRPNPLLPAELQRRAGVPAARADSLAAQARAMQALWCASAGEVVFSWAAQEGEKPLQPSPLLADAVSLVPPREVLPPAAQAFAAAGMERLDDSRAPAVAAGERIRGGTALLRAQALCPAWGFYRYRLGAAVLPAPTFGLDAKTRGALLHLALEAFWRGRSQADLAQMQGPVREEAIHRAVSHALGKFQKRAIEPLPPRLAHLEAGRLQALLLHWLAIEAQRAPFRVIACEERHELTIEGLPVHVVVDRIDALDDGRLIVIDYKSGKSATAESWAKPRMAEPQLPVYAALAFPDQAVAAVVLARVVIDAAGFSGLAEEAGLLPGVQSLEEQRRRYAAADFPDWAAVRQRWAERISELAREIRDGCAAVVFEDEKDIAYCDVKPLLRAAERHAQWEAQREEQEGSP